MNYAKITQVPPQSALLNSELPIQSDISGDFITFTPDEIGDYSFQADDGSASNQEWISATLEGLSVRVSMNSWRPVAVGSAPVVPIVHMDHQLTNGVVLEVDVQNGAIVAARLNVASSDTAATYASVDPAVLAQVRALVNTDVSTVEAAVASGSPLMTAWAAAMKNTAPTVPNVDPAVGALIMQGWTKS